MMHRYTMAVLEVQKMTKMRKNQKTKKSKIQTKIKLWARRVNLFWILKSIDWKWRQIDLEELVLAPDSRGIARTPKSVEILKNLEQKLRPIFMSGMTTWSPREKKSICTKKCYAPRPKPQNPQGRHPAARQPANLSEHFIFVCERFPGDKTRVVRQTVNQVSAWRTRRAH